ncbi:hypothetical protein [Neisseria sp. 83E34]|uniref:hypothetical protein n=1 Tax=Neisseria sp. 83E34 TaxID=1692264 RepID=UPI0006CE9B99|nr:hypothetical protein [Neisseria sp. 83E34]KPN70861.1 hypothetical protein AKG09_10140 [Neisseria sp. 83E34]
MKKTAFLALAATTLLSACNKQPETSVSPEAASSAASAINEAASIPQSAVQTLTSKDGKLSIVIENSSFADISKEARALPPGVNAADLTMMQQDDAQNITLYTTNLGKPKKPANEYFANLKKHIEADPSLKDVKTGIATENRMDYHYSQTSGDETLNETCVAVYSTEGLYNICAYSPSATTQQLDSVLKNIKLNH